MTLHPGDTVTVQPSDSDDPLAVQMAGQKLRVRSISALNTHIVVEHPETRKRFVFREQDLRKS